MPLPDSGESWPGGIGEATVYPAPISGMFRRRCRELTAGLMNPPSAKPVAARSLACGEVGVAALPAPVYIDGPLVTECSAAW